MAKQYLDGCGQQLEERLGQPVQQHARIKERIDKNPGLL